MIEKSAFDATTKFVISSGSETDFMGKYEEYVGIYVTVKGFIIRENKVKLPVTVDFCQ